MDTSSKVTSSVPTVDEVFSRKLSETSVIASTTIPDSLPGIYYCINNLIILDLYIYNHEFVINLLI